MVKQIKRKKSSTGASASPGRTNLRNTEFYFNLEMDIQALRGKNKELVQNAAKLTQEKRTLQNTLNILQKENFKLSSKYSNLRNVLNAVDSNIKNCFPKLTAGVKHLTQIMNLCSVGSDMICANTGSKQSVTPNNNIETNITPKSIRPRSNMNFRSCSSVARIPEMTISNSSLTRRNMVPENSGDFVINRENLRSINDTENSGCFEQLSVDSQNASGETRSEEESIDALMETEETFEERLCTIGEETDLENLDNVKEIRICLTPCKLENPSSNGNFELKNPYLDRTLVEHFDHSMVVHPSNSTTDKSILNESTADFTKNADFTNAAGSSKGAGSSNTASSSNTTILPTNNCQIDSITTPNSESLHSDSLFLRNNKVNSFTFTSQIPSTNVTTQPSDNSHTDHPTSPKSVERFHIDSQLFRNNKSIDSFTFTSQVSSTEQSPKLSGSTRTSLDRSNRNRLRPSKQKERATSTPINQNVNPSPNFSNQIEGPKMSNKINRKKREGPNVAQVVVDRLELDTSKHPVRRLSEVLDITPILSASGIKTRGGIPSGGAEPHNTPELPQCANQLSPAAKKFTKKSWMKKKQKVPPAIPLTTSSPTRPKRAARPTTTLKEPSLNKKMRR